MKQNEKGSRKSSFWQFPRSLLKAKEGKNAKTKKKETNTKKNEKGSRKNSVWQFPRSILKAKEGKNAKTKKK
jgi:hypothetical protein